MPWKSPIVSALVVDVHLAASQAIAQHLHRVLDIKGRSQDLGKVAAALDHGYIDDLDDFVSDDQVLGFDHHLVSSVFRQKLQQYAGKSFHETQFGKPTKITAYSRCLVPRRKLHSICEHAGHAPHPFCKMRCEIADHLGRQRRRQRLVSPQNLLQSLRHCLLPRKY